MARTVDTGWRRITPGECLNCGFETDWEVDGRGTVYCSCQCCPGCSELDGHTTGCSEIEPDPCGDFEPGPPWFGDCELTAGHGGRHQNMTRSWPNEDAPQEDEENVA